MMKYFNGEPIEIVLTPSNKEIEEATEAAKLLMSQKIEQWILDRLTIAQLESCIAKFKNELERRLK